MGSRVVVLVLKRSDYGAYLVHTREQVRVNYFGAVRAVKTPDVAILCRFAGLNTIKEHLDIINEIMIDGDVVGMVRKVKTIVPEYN